MRSVLALASAVSAFVVAGALTMQPGTWAAGSSTTISMSVPSATSLTATSCATGTPGRTDFGVVQPSTTAITSLDCHIDFGSSNDTSRLMLTQTDRLGQAMWGGESTGAPDTSFDGDGIALKSLLASSHESFFDAVYQDGRGMISAGRQFVGADGEEFSVTRTLPNGSLDTSFGTGGSTRLAVAGPDYASTVAMAPDGTIVVGGMRGGSMVLARLDAEGALVSSWGTGGVVLNDFFAGSEEPLDMAVQADGTIIAAGWVDGANPDAYVAKFLANGSLDPSFGIGGARRVDVGGSRDLGWRLAMQPDGKVVVVGSARQLGNGEDDVLVLRFTAAGALDTTFSGDGIYTWDGGVGIGNDLGSSLVVNGDGTILVGGQTPGAAADLLVLKLLASGTLDTSFGTGGAMFRDDGGSNASATDMDVLPNGSIAIIGSRGFANTAVQAWRLLPNGSSDTSFSGDGYQEYAVPGASSIDVREQVIGPDGSVWFAGFGTGADEDYLTGRLTTTTIPDYAAGRWTAAVPLFGGCLRDATNATPTWTEDANLTCTAADSDPWNPIARLSTDPSAEIARTANGITAGAVDLRFGMRVGTTQRPGRLVAPFTFELIAPA